MDKCGLQRILIDEISKHSNCIDISIDDITDKILSLFRVKCPECGGFGKERLHKDVITSLTKNPCPSCDKGFITVDVQKMYEVLKELSQSPFIETECPAYYRQIIDAIKGKP